jgi:hypothetical protein
VTFNRGCRKKIEIETNSSHFDFIAIVLDFSPSSSSLTELTTPMPR